MNLRTLELFCDVAARRSFSRAAEANSVSQSMASQAVHVLEDKLGVQLINRSKRPLELTSAGAMYFDGCRPLLEKLRELEDAVRLLSDTITGRLKIASIYSAGIDELRDVLREFQSAFPQVDVSIEYLHPSEVYDRVRTDKADLGLASFPREGGEFQSVAWKTQQMVAVVPVDDPLAVLDEIQVEQINGREFVAFTTELRIRRQLDRWLKQAGVGVKVVQEFDNIENIKRAVESGTGISILPAESLDREVDFGSLHTMRLTDADWVRPLGIVQRRRKHLSVAAEKFIGMLIDPEVSSESDFKPTKTAT